MTDVEFENGDVGFQDGDVEFPGAAATTTLTVSGITIGTYVDALAIVADWWLYVSGIVQANPIDDISLVQEHNLSTFDIASQSQIDSLVITAHVPGTYTISSITAITQKNFIDDISLAQEHNLFVSAISAQTVIDALGVFELEYVLSLPAVTSQVHFAGPELYTFVFVSLYDVDVSVFIPVIGSLEQKHVLNIGELLQYNILDDITVNYGSGTLGQVIDPYLISLTVLRTINK